MKDRNFDGPLLTQPTNIAWFTGGTEPPRGLFGQVTAALLLTPESITLLARRSDVEVMLGSESSLVGLQHRVCEWPEDSRDLLKDWSQPKRLACDRSLDVGDDVSSDIAAMRLPLSSMEIEILRKLGIRVARAIEKAAREFQRGDTEAQIAGDVASRWVRHEVVPERIQVWGDGRGKPVRTGRFAATPSSIFARFPWPLVGKDCMSPSRALSVSERPPKSFAGHTPTGC